MHPLARRVTGIRAFLHTVAALHVGVYRASGGRVGSSWNGLDFLLLHTTGARTGRTRTVPLLYMRHPDGEAAERGATPGHGALVVVASNGGRRNDPGWLHNLRRTPQVRVTTGRETWRARAREAAPSERERLWPLLDQLYPYDEYRAHTAREIPIVLLERM